MKINANACLNNTAGENKAIRVRELRALRRDRGNIEQLPDFTSGMWPDEPHARIVFEDMELRDKEGSRQWLHNVHKGALERRTQLMVYSNVGFTANYQQTKWGVRGYNLPQLVVQDCDFTEITQEHGMYMSNSSSVTSDT